MSGVGDRWNSRGSPNVYFFVAKGEVGSCDRIGWIMNGFPQPHKALGSARGGIVFRFPNSSK